MLIYMVFSIVPPLCGGMEVHMQDNNSFIGLGHNSNPKVPDIPIGFGMALFQHPEARASYDNLSDAEKTRLIGYIQSGNSSGAETKNKLVSAVNDLDNGNASFF